MPLHRFLPASPLAAVLALGPLPSLAQAPQPAGWQACAAVAGATERLACFDRWAAGQGAATNARATTPAASALQQEIIPPAPAEPEIKGPPTQTPGLLPRFWRDLQLTALQGCRDNSQSEISRFWELEPATDCGTFGLRGYRPITVAVSTADTVNRQPSSGNPLNNVGSPTDYRTTEARLQLSVRTKLASGLLSSIFPDRSDSLWLGYTQQSYWQIFTPALSRPFRSTDHEPEIMYVMPLQSADPTRWRLRYAGVGAAHQSNGQSLPWSRSWNRAYLMAGAEKGPVQLHGRVWRRFEPDSQDDNPGITHYLGRAEMRASWQASDRHTFAATVRHNLHREGKGSLRLEWFRALGDTETPRAGGLKFHTQLFTGYGDSLLDYNRRRTVLTVGMSLVDW